MPDLTKAELMRRAIALAMENVQEGGGPFAALVVKDGVVVAEGANRVTATNDPTAHAEVMAIRAACAALDTFQLTGCDLYTTCEPCPMCLGAIYWARPDRVFYASGKLDAAGAGFDDAFIYEEIERAPVDRKIPMAQLLGGEAAAVFAAWNQNADRIDY
jgi:tRNA(Arg) A34 adenosine deaminase TadA